MARNPSAQVTHIQWHEHQSRPHGFKFNELYKPFSANINLYKNEIYYLHGLSPVQGYCTV